MIGLVDRERVDSELYDDYETEKARQVLMLLIYLSFLIRIIYIGYEGTFNFMARERSPCRLCRFLKWFGVRCISFLRKYSVPSFSVIDISSYWGYNSCGYCTASLSCFKINRVC